VWQRIQERLREIDREEEVSTQCAQLEDVAPARTDPALQAAIREAARSADLATSDLPSGAVQDAQQVAKVAPIGMIFVPSRDGISHSPREFTPSSEIAGGAEVLYRTVLLLDGRLDPR
jgi:N-carbamoyl-L-amino-acid hydrolase